jgi:hypothetical protein
LGPSPEIHPNRGAFSFGRDLKWRFFLVYSLSKNLVTAVQRALMGLHQVTLERATPPQQKNDDWNRLAATISTFLILLRGWFLFHPHVSLHPDQRLNPNDPFSTEFTITNEDNWKQRSSGTPVTALGYSSLTSSL